MWCLECVLKSCAKSSPGLESVPRAAKHPAPILAPVPSGGNQPSVGQYCCGQTPVPWGTFMAQLLHKPSSGKRAQVCTVPFRAQYAIEWESSFLHRPRIWGPCGQCLPATMPGNSPCWSRWNYTHPSTLGSLWLDDQTPFFKLQIELGKQIICNFGAMTFLVWLYTSAAVILGCKEDT